MSSRYEFCVFNDGLEETVLAFKLWVRLAKLMLPIAELAKNLVQDRRNRLSNL